MVAKTSSSQTEIRDWFPYIALLGTPCNLVYPPLPVLLFFPFCFKNWLSVPNYLLFPVMTYQYIWVYKPSYAGTIICETCQLTVKCCPQKGSRTLPNHRHRKLRTKAGVAQVSAGASLPGRWVSEILLPLNRLWNPGIGALSGGRRLCSPIFSFWNLLLQQNCCCVPCDCRGGANTLWWLSQRLLNTGDFTEEPKALGREWGRSDSQSPKSFWAISLPGINSHHQEAPWFLSFVFFPPP